MDERTATNEHGVTDGDCGEYRALGSLVASVGVLVVNAKVDRFIGRVESLENAHNTHVNMPGLHGIR